MFDTEVSVIGYGFDFLKLIFIYWLIVTVVRFFAVKDEAKREHRHYRSLTRHLRAEVVPGMHSATNFVACRLLVPSIGAMNCDHSTNGSRLGILR